MRAYQRHRTSEEKKVASNKKMDYMQKSTMTPEQKKAWDRKPYGGKKDG